jgi:hypothetical protein
VEEKMSKFDCQILVADDEDFFRDALVEALVFFGYKNVKPVRNGEELRKEAKELLDSNADFLLIVDNQMPEEEDGTEVQWCGFDKVLALCEEYPQKNLGEKVLFLSRWGIVDLSEDQRQEAKSHNLLRKDQWLKLATPFFMLKGEIEQMIEKGKADDK